MDCKRFERFERFDWMWAVLAIFFSPADPLAQLRVRVWVMKSLSEAQDYLFLYLLKFALPAPSSDQSRG